MLGRSELFLPPEASPADGDQPGSLPWWPANIVMVERELGQPHDFRRWVCLHEETHRLQFTAVTWLRDYVQGQMSSCWPPNSTRRRSSRARLRSAADAMARCAAATAAA